MQERNGRGDGLGAFPSHRRIFGLIVLTLSLLAAGFSARDSLAAWRRTLPVDAAPAAPNDPYLRLRVAENRYSDQSYLASHAAELRRASQQVLVSQPLSALAMRQLGLLAAIKQPAGGAAEFALAERVSRRDVPSQFVLIDLAAQRNDLSATLVHYNRALLVRPTAGSLLYPVLSLAISDADVRRGLSGYANRPWFDEFLDAAEDAKADSSSLVALHAAIRASGGQSQLRPAGTRLLARLVNEGNYAGARDLLRSFRGVPPGALETFGFNAATTDTRLARLGWDIRNGDSGRGEMAADILTVYAAPERSALVADRITLFAPGRYELIQRIAYLDDAPPAGLQWVAMCLSASKARILQSQVVPNAAQPGISTQFTIPSDCAAQYWTLHAMTDLSQQEFAVRIEQLTLARR